MPKLLNGLSVSEVKALVSSPKLCRSEIAQNIGVTAVELNRFISKTLRPPAKKPIKVCNGLRIVDGVKNIRVDCDHREGTIRKRVSISILKLGKSAKDIERELQSAIKHFESLLQSKELEAAIGVITPNVEYTIPGLHFECSQYHLKKGLIRICLNVRQKKLVNSRSSSKDYTEFCRCWILATDTLTALNGFSEKPPEWATPPSEEFYDRMLGVFTDRYLST